MDLFHRESSMPSAFEIAPSGRARCRGCERPIAKESLRFGERLPNPFGDGEMTLWFHPTCAALTRPDVFLEVLEATDAEVEERDVLEALARDGLAHRRLPRLHGAERSPSGRARCRACRELIEKDTWRLALVYYQEGRFEPSGFIHAHCAGPYFETTEIVDRLQRIARLSDEDAADLVREISA